VSTPLALSFEDRERGNPFPKVSRSANRQEMFCQEDVLLEVEDIHVRKGLPELRADWQT